MKRLVLGYVALLVMYIGTNISVNAWSFYQQVDKNIIYLVNAISFLIVVEFGYFIVRNIMMNLTRQPQTGPLVVLGGGLVQGQYVGKIVGARVDLMAQDAHSIYKTTGEWPIMVFSGGQGPDEILSEARAMRDYAVLKYKIPLEKTILEEHSRNTFQNIALTYRIIRENFTLYTSNYHLYRALMLAKQQGLNVSVRGAHTKYTYKMFALLREFSGMIKIWQKVNFIYAALVITFTIYYISNVYLYK
ncbi:YdcF family protein [Leuconostoc fallax]|nr:YdcF family protein [Leuconostoc fallax]MCO6184414.1 YdcF family protein [Leuconostoc fallax]